MAAAEGCRPNGYLQPMRAKKYWTLHLGCVSLCGSFLQMRGDCARHPCHAILWAEVQYAEEEDQQNSSETLSKDRHR